ncbi:hypothetical protein Cgig2_029466 [Carnegiea gigantea]|uniref:DUF7870 domain-containing protein n=1 Tax=Carnegiea gigantea TaxID=171969 RepID=A0A9Q1QKI8_9CARY|nr:hypothetical protein Cgig2_029466 [Carnegiea gigantea]
MKLNNVRMELPYVHEKYNYLHGCHANPTPLIVVRLSDSKVMKILAQALVLALLIMALPRLSANLRETLRGSHNYDSLDLKSLPLVLDDLAKHGIMTTSKVKSVIINTGEQRGMPETLANVENVVISPWETERHRLVPDESFNIAFTNCFHGEVRGFIDRTLKLGGTLVVQVSRDPFRAPPNYKMAYLRKVNDETTRVYIDVGGGHGSTRWFEQNYPTRNKDFDIYHIETVPETEVETSSDDAWEGPPTQMGISDWLWRNVKAEEYVVMKAEAEVVEEMLKSKAIVLVDELFLECKPWGKGGKSKRAYWECLALYGRLRDVGVVVHQWWG